MPDFIRSRLGNGLLAHLVNAALISIQVLLCLIVLSPVLYRFTLGKHEPWLLPWVWMSPEMLVRLSVVGVLMTLCFGFGAWIIERHRPRNGKSP